MHLTLTPPIFYFFILGALHLETTLYSGSDALFFMLFHSEFGEIYQVLFTEPFFFGNFRHVKLSENNNKCIEKPALLHVQVPLLTFLLSGPIQSRLRDGFEWEHRGAVRKQNYMPP
jgi:hypothetical protein